MSKPGREEGEEGGMRMERQRGPPLAGQKHICEGSEE